ncbi:hypothetical protein RJ639_046287 [Escallonia herrerae]|uniref:Membrane-associated kinase regulator 1 n=1 Tax=Escallonia herrerae TaxID=1293975 RepID=A0AA88W8H7_9ASTE|nr:hypothetical protein RJ639_046287 [Escallonia herrerae]
MQKMGRRAEMNPKWAKSQTLPSSPTHSSSSSDFEFTVSLSPRAAASAASAPADELFYKGQLLPLHLSPRLSMVRTLLLASSSSSSSSASPRDSSGSSSDSLLLSDSSRPSSATADEDHLTPLNKNPIKKPPKYFSLSRFSSVFRKEPKIQNTDTNPPGSSVRQVICRYLKKVKPLYEKLSMSQRQHQKMDLKAKPAAVLSGDGSVGITGLPKNSNGNSALQSFSGNLRYGRSRRSCVSSCPSSMRSSPCHSGILGRNGGLVGPRREVVGGGGNAASMDELQSAIQGAIAHCKNSMVQSTASKAVVMVSNEI